MKDRILIRDLLLRAIIGVNPSERIGVQDVLINIELEVDLRSPGASDDIHDAVNYRTIAKHVVDLVEGSRFSLVEKLATEIASLCLQDRRVELARVRVEKPSALRFARSVGVEIERRRGEP
ncbi:MAG: dihydroneopterin aldolase [Chloroflexi bacterium]|jgi:FolB domain-containing protein|nr:dihydroneopterin aldolase [Chloroflexota bacterium]